MIKVERINEILKDCLFRPDELNEAGGLDDMSLAALVEGVTVSVGLNKERLETYRDEVQEMVDQLPDSFRTENGDSFVNMCVTKDGAQWGEHPNMQELMFLSVGLDLMESTLPRPLWGAAGGVPVLRIK